ncbi:hypothetical protein PYW07_004708 [Mythimna separata]|uniref:Uncharacterized protein n=1 Tax=Mythimna separata TaxID=271217 RepID=A0AAD7YXE5_MYTSE|nr:hypothetical protein PYW07_004708 [Mythimna separata]
MKSFIVAACLIACVYAASPEQTAQILRSSSDQTPEGNFQYSFETDNGINAQASGAVKPLGKDEVAIEITGSNSYTGPDGVVYAVNYVANENGFQAQGAHLPTPPPTDPIPEYIQRSLEYIAAHPYTEKKA